MCTSANRGLWDLTASQVGLGVKNLLLMQKTSETWV